MIIFVIAMKNFLLAILSGILFSISWPVDGIVYFIFFAFTPLLYLNSKFDKKEKSSALKFFFFSFIAFFIFNIITTYWVYFASPFGAIFAFVINSFLMSFVMLLFFYSDKIFSKRLAYFSLIVFWLTFEYLHLNWDLSWPWLTLGNCFSESLFLINWYQYTGVLGGTLWILFLNVLFYELIVLKKKKTIYFLFFFITIPFFISQILSNKKDIKNDTFNVVVVQPNVDPYLEKFTINFKDQLNDFIRLARTQVDTNTNLIVGPETALQEPIWESKVNYSESIIELKKLQLDFPKLNILLGATTYKLFKKSESKSSTARQFRNEDLWYDIYNSAIYIPNNQKISVYHKTKLVPGAEQIPFPALLNSFSSLSVDLGGVSGSLGRENTTESFEVDKFSLLPLICYESIYGDLNTAKFFDVMCIITNDGWWKNTAGYKQHFSYSKLRAIEQNRSIIRCANTGISAFISSQGEVLDIANWDEQKVLKSQVDIYNTVTFYNRYGDYLGRLSSFISSIFILMIFVKSKIQ